MRLVYASSKVETPCTSFKAAQKFFGGNDLLAKKLHSCIQALRSAEVIKDIIVQPRFRFHKLDNKNNRNLEGLFAIDVKSSKDPWRLILQPLDENENPYVPCNIDEISGVVKIVGIVEVSKHYE